MVIEQLPIGAKVREPKSGMVFLVADHRHTGYHGTTLVTDEIIEIACFDAAEPNHPDSRIAESGSAFYPDSNIHLWLNSASEKWYHPMHTYDAPPTEENLDEGWSEVHHDSPMIDPDGDWYGSHAFVDKPGFLHRFPRSFIEALELSDVPCFEAPQPGTVRHGPAVPLHIRCRVFLPSALEIGADSFSPGPEGHRIRLFNEPRMLVAAPSAEAMGREKGWKYRSSIFYWLLRSPKPGQVNRCLTYNSRSAPGDYSSGICGSGWCNLVSGIRPVMNVRNETPVSDISDESGVSDLLL